MISQRRRTPSVHAEMADAELKAETTMEPELTLSDMAKAVEHVESTYSNFEEPPVACVASPEDIEADIALAALDNQDTVPTLPVGADMAVDYDNDVDSEHRFVFVDSHENDNPSASEVSLQSCSCLSVAYPLESREMSSLVCVYHISSCMCGFLVVLVFDCNVWEHLPLCCPYGSRSQSKRLVWSCEVPLKSSSYFSHEPSFKISICTLRACWNNSNRSVVHFLKLGNY